MRGKFVSFEGIDGAGKSSHIAACVSALQARGIRVVQSREPGGTALSEKLRELILHERMHSPTEALLVFAARQEHVLEVIEPALARGDWVLCDRFTDATLAYQGAGRGFDRAKLNALAEWVHGGLKPDLTLVFNCSPQVAAERLAKARAADKFEREDSAFFERVAQGYLQLAKAEPARFEVIDSEAEFGAVQSAALKALERVL
jgi:dTMP kinase